MQRLQAPRSRTGDNPQCVLNARHGGAGFDFVVEVGGGIGKISEMIDKAGQHLLDGVAGVVESGLELALFEDHFLEASLGIVNGALRQLPRYRGFACRPAYEPQSHRPPTGNGLASLKLR